MKYRMQAYRLKKEGSFTIEAALIMPVILGVIVLFIYIAMYSYDRCVIEYVCQSAASRAVREGEEMAAGYAEAELYARLICRWVTKIEFSSDEEGLTAEIEAYLPAFGREFTHASTAYEQFLPKY